MIIPNPPPLFLRPGVSIGLHDSMSCHSPRRRRSGRALVSPLGAPAARWLPRWQRLWHQRRRCWTIGQYQWIARFEDWTSYGRRNTRTGTGWRDELARRARRRRQKACWHVVVAAEKSVEANTSWLLKAAAAAITTIDGDISAGDFTSWHLLIFLLGMLLSSRSQDGSISPLHTQA